MACCQNVGCELGFSFRMHNAMFFTFSIFCFPLRLLLEFKVVGGENEGRKRKGDAISFNS